MKTSRESSLEVLTEVLPLFEATEDYSVQGLHDMLMDYIKRHELKNGFVLWPIRIALSGKEFTPGGAIEIASILGKEEGVRRIQIGIKMLSK
jgi:glutamyl-tRNA synthetase